MIYAFIRSYIGGFGRALMDFYIANSFVINGIVLFYGLLVYLAHISYLKAYRSVLEALGVKLNRGSKGKGKSKVVAKSKLDFEKVSWDTVRRSFWFPFIAEPKRLLITPKTNSVLKKYFSANKIAKLLNTKTTE